MNEDGSNRVAPPLEGCPFCGRPPMINVRAATCGEGGGHVCIISCTCGTHLACAHKYVRATTEEVAIQACAEAWNRRDMSVALTPCPWCGDGGVLEIGHGTKDREGWPAYVLCSECGCQGPWVYVQCGAGDFTVESASMGPVKEAWNRRSGGQ